ncbi:MAG: VIT domain-containing protein, partial [Planctomycetota bacterium]
MQIPLRITLTILIGILTALLPTSGAHAQELQTTPSVLDSRSSHVVLPQARAWVVPHGAALHPNRRETALILSGVSARVDILERVATTEIEVRLTNTSRRQVEGVVLLPVPSGAAVSGFDFEGAAAEPQATLLPKEEARRTYDDIVRRLKDPALLEFAGFELLRSSVFPVPANGTQRVRITYTQICEQDGDRIDYVLPRSESLQQKTPWDIQVTLRGRTNAGAIYSPSHELAEVVRPASQVGPTLVSVSPTAATTPGSFRLSWIPELAQDQVQATLYAYPDPEVGGGFFLLLAGVPARLADRDKIPPREVTLVIDRSGSMRGGKLDQAVAAALQVIEGLKDGERFNLIDYSNQAALFASGPVEKNAASITSARTYLDSLRPTGGTNIKDAIVEALRQKPTPGSVPIVLFLTDGLPTVGTRSESAIGAAVREANEAGRRVFTFGVGSDVNAPLLDRISEDTRGFTTYVDPGQDVELAVDRVFRRLSGPVLAEPTLRLVDEQGALDTQRVRELCPARLPDLYEGGTTVLLGQYRGDDPLRFRLEGDFLGERREFAFQFALDRATTRNAFVPRLWATRRIAFLVEEIRQAGAELSAAELAGHRNLMTETRYAELGEEVLRLSTTYGVLSEYTAFLALEGSALSDWNTLVTKTNENLSHRAVQSRTGTGAVSQGKNFQVQKVQACVNVSNVMWNAANERVEFANVQQVCDRA